MGALRQLGLLLWKNLLRRVRSPVSRGGARLGLGMGRKMGGARIKRKYRSRHGDKGVGVGRARYDQDGQVQARFLLFISAGITVEMFSFRSC